MGSAEGWARDTRPLNPRAGSEPLPAPSDQGAALMTRAWLHIIINPLNLTHNEYETQGFRPCEAM